MYFGFKAGTRLHIGATRAFLVVALGLVCGISAFSDPIHDAARKGDLKKVQAILASDPKAVNAQDNAGDTPLHQAVLHGNYKVAEALIAAGADVNVKNSYPPFLPEDLGRFFQSKDHANPAKLLHSQASNTSNALNTHGMTQKEIVNNGYTPLGLAEFPIDHNKMVQLLVAHGANVNAQGSSGATPLFWAVMCDRNDDVKFLLDHGANPNLTNAFGDTPLIAAIQLGYLSMVKPLVEKGADVNVKNQSEMRALGYAMSNPEADSIIDYLKKHGAQQ